MFSSTIVIPSSLYYSNNNKNKIDNVTTIESNENKNNVTTDNVNAEFDAVPKQGNNYTITNFFIFI